MSLYDLADELIFRFETLKKRLGMEPHEFIQEVVLFTSEHETPDEEEFSPDGVNLAILFQQIIDTETEEEYFARLELDPEDPDGLRKHLN